MTFDGSATSSTEWKVQRAEQHYREMFERLRLLGDERLEERTMQIAREVEERIPPGVTGMGEYENMLRAMAAHVQAAVENALLAVAVQLATYEPPPRSDAER